MQGQAVPALLARNAEILQTLQGLNVLRGGAPPCRACHKLLFPTGLSTSHFEPRLRRRTGKRLAPDPRLLRAAAARTTYPGSSPRRDRAPRLREQGSVDGVQALEHLLLEEVLVP
jgi:hypothetical protein